MSGADGADGAAGGGAAMQWALGGVLGAAVAPFRNMLGTVVNGCMPGWLCRCACAARVCCARVLCVCAVRVCCGCCCWNGLCAMCAVGVA